MRLIKSRSWTLVAARWLGSSPAPHSSCRSSRSRSGDRASIRFTKAGTRTPTGRSRSCGYFNRNAKEALDVPIGPNNKVEPGGRIWGSRRTSSRGAAGACSRSGCRPISATRSWRGRSTSTA